MKKIFFTCNRLGYGGAERVICSLCNRLADNGIECSIVCLDVIEGFHYAINKGVNIVRLNENVGKRQSWFARKMWGIVYLYRLLCLLRNERPDIVCSFYSKQNCYSILCSRLAHIPIVCSERDSFFLSDGKANHLLRSIFYKYANGFIHQTNWAKTYLEEKYGTTKDALVLHNPLWIESFPQRNPVRGKVIAVGRLELQKNYKGLIRAFVKAKSSIQDELTLSIFGKGPSKRELDEFIVANGAQEYVTLKGQVDNVLKEYANAEFLVLFSHGEGYPNVLMEALACGVPCISSDCPIGGPAEMIENEVNGILVENENEEELADAIVTLHSDESLREKLSQNAILIRKSNSLDVIYTAFYNYLLHIYEKSCKSR